MKNGVSLSALSTLNLAIVSSTKTARRIVNRMYSSTEQTVLSAVCCWPRQSRRATEAQIPIILDTKSHCGVCITYWNAHIQIWFVNLKSAINKVQQTSLAFYQQIWLYYCKHYWWIWFWSIYYMSGLVLFAALCLHSSKDWDVMHFQLVISTRRLRSISESFTAPLTCHEHSIRPPLSHYVLRLPKYCLSGSFMLLWWRLSCFCYQLYISRIFPCF